MFFFLILVTKHNMILQGCILWVEFLWRIRGKGKCKTKFLDSLKGDFIAQYLVRQKTFLYTFYSILLILTWKLCWLTLLLFIQVHSACRLFKSY